MRERLIFERTGQNTGYLRMEGLEVDLKGGQTRTLSELLGRPYEGPFVAFDFDKEGRLVGVEVVGNEDEEDDREVDMEVVVE